MIINIRHIQGIGWNKYSQKMTILGHLEVHIIIIIIISFF